MNKNGNTTRKNLCNAAKAVFRGTFLGVREYTRKNGLNSLNLVSILRN